MFKSALRQDDDWWFRFQSEKIARGNSRNVRTENRPDDRSKRTLVRRFLHSLMYKVKEREPPPNMRNFSNFSLNLLKASMLTVSSGTRPEFRMDRRSDKAALMSRTHFARLLRLCASSTKISLFDRQSTSVASNRVVCIQGLAGSTSIATTVSLVCGGGLEKIAYLEGHKPTVELHFLKSESATAFVDYSKKNALMCVNGFPLSVTWAKPSRGLASGHTPLPPYIKEEVEGYRASRVIVLTRPVQKRLGNGSAASRGYPDPKDNYLADLNIEKVKWDFVQFGGIVEVSPMISSKLSISIQYTDIRSAILAMHTLAQKNSLLHSKYSQWTAKYMRDVTARPCLTA